MKVLVKLLRKSYQSLGNKCFSKYYRDLNDIPIARFSECMNGNLRKVSKNTFFDESKGKEVWSKMFKQHIDSHGLPASFVAYANKMTKAIDHYDKAYSGQKWQIVKARIYEQEAKNMITGNGESIDKTCAVISKFMGFPVESNKTSAASFYNYVEIMNINT